MAPECPGYSLELQYPHEPGHCSIWSEYGIYRSFGRAMAKAGLQARRCRIVEHRVVWRSRSICPRRRWSEKIGRAACCQQHRGAAFLGPSQAAFGDIAISSQL